MNKSAHHSPLCNDKKLKTTYVSPSVKPFTVAPMVPGGLVGVEMWAPLLNFMPFQAACSGVFFFFFKEKHFHNLQRTS